MKPLLRIHRLVLGSLLGALLCGVASAQSTPPGLAKRTPAITRPATGQTLTGSSQAGSLDAVAGFLRGKGASQATVASLRAVSENRVARTGITHLRVEQQIQGLTVHGAYAKAALNGNGELVHWIDLLVPASNTVLVPATISEAAALAAAMARVHPAQQAALTAGARNGNATTFAGGPFFHADPTVTRVAVPMSDGALAVGFLVETWSRTGNQLHHTLVGGDGRVLNIQSRTANDTYNVFLEDPSKGAQIESTGPGASSPESPAGWLGSGGQTTVNISGNNVNAYLDADKNNRPDRGGTAVVDGNFLTLADLSQSPTTSANRNVSVQNLFFLNNVVHDVLYAHGFTEATGNFQADNFGLGGAGNDPVKAEAQDGSGTDNANFATPADGKSPRMQMFLWSGADPTHQVLIGGNVYGASGAEFGPKLSVTGLTGVLADTGGDGCGAIGVSLQGSIAIIDRGTCEFTVKVLNAQQAGAMAVIIVNNVGENESFTMGGSERRVKIPSVMVGLADGTAIRVAAKQNATLRLNPIQPLRIDASLDADIVYHEYGHGLTWRMIGNMSGPLAGAIGEGASDVLAFLLNGDDRIAEYSASNPIGIRSQPYDLFSRTYRSVDGSAVHDDGEVYAAAMWKARQNLLAMAIPASESVVLNYFVDGMNYTPASPTFESMRDGMLQAITIPEHKCAVWRGFAALGIGVGSSATVSGSTVTVVESFAVPQDCPPPQPNP